MKARAVLVVHQQGQDFAEYLMLQTLAADCQQMIAPYEKCFTHLVGRYTGPPGCAPVDLAASVIKPTDS